MWFVHIRKVPYLLAVLLLTCPARAELPIRATVVSSTGSVACSPSYYLKASSRQLFIPFVPCEQGMITLSSGQDTDWVTLDLPGTTVVRLDFAGPMNAITVRKCAGCGDALTAEPDVFVSTDGLEWIKLDTWRPSTPRQGETGMVRWFASQDAVRSYQGLACTIPWEGTVVYVRGNGEHGVDILSVEGARAPPTGD